jgi:putative serine protease PepD
MDDTERTPQQPETPQTPQPPEARETPAELPPVTRPWQPAAGPSPAPWWSHQPDAPSEQTPAPSAHDVWRPAGPAETGTGAETASDDTTVLSAGTGATPPPLPPYGSMQYAGPPDQPAAGRSRRRSWKMPVAAAVTAAALCVGSGTVGAVIAGQDGGGNTTITAAQAKTVSGGDQPTETLAKVAAAVQPSVVSITVRTQGGTGEGSGVILRSDGTILTNNHVVESAANGGAISVEFSDGKTASAEILGRDPGSDLAVIKAKDVDGLTPATLGESSSVHVGDTVLAIGSPLGLEGTVSAGIISALHRPVQLGGEEQQQQQNPFTDPFGSGQQQQQQSPSSSLSDAIQTDAPINPGNSGGPLVDTSGAVIGINTAIATTGSGVGGQAGSIGLGFAIPIDQAKKVADQLIKGEQPKHALLGVQATDSPNGDGAVIGTVSSGSAADKAGIKAGDRITALGKDKVSDASELASAVRAHDPGEKVTITFVRNGRTETASATLGSGT